MGDVNNGLYFGDQDLRFGPINVDDRNIRIGLALQVMNAGNAGPDEVRARLQATGDTLAGTVGGVGASDVAAALAGAGAESLPAGGEGLWLLIAAGGIEALNLLWSWLAVDCDGIVACDLINTPRLEFDQLTAVTGRSPKFGPRNADITDQSVKGNFKESTWNDDSIRVRRAVPPAAEE